MTILSLRNCLIVTCCAALVATFCGVDSSTSVRRTNGDAKLPPFLDLLRGGGGGVQVALRQIRQNWEISYVPMVLETIHLNQGGGIASQLFGLLEENTGESFGTNVSRWYEWLWGQEYTPHPQYATFKSNLYGLIDPKFSGYFDPTRTSRIRLDEVRWGGVLQDGIPPLLDPQMIRAEEAAYLEDNHVVFGLEVNGDARAYPKRILAWHEMFVDEVGGEPVTGVYCTLCGSMIPYRSTVGDVTHQLGTSGFLYRSNKLMYDKETQSLWNTLEGKPVYHEALGDTTFVVLTDPSGANRVYEDQGRTFVRWDGDATVVDGEGTSWRVDEDQLVSADGKTLARLPAHRAFWFGWYAVYGNTRLVH